MLSYEEAFHAYWHPVAFASELGEKPVPVKLLGRDLVIWRTGDGVAATSRYCAHRGADLIGATVVGSRLQCEYHGWQYDGGGQCVLVPSQANSPIPVKARIEGVLCQERYHLIWVCLAPEPKAPLPDWSAINDANVFSVVEVAKLDWATSAGRYIENLLDVTHLSWVHQGTFGNPERAAVPPYDVQRVEGGLHAEFLYDALSPPGIGEVRKADRTRLVYDVTFPFAARMATQPTVFFPHTLHLAGCPVSEEKMVGFYFASYPRRYTMFPGVYVKQELKVIEEDRVVLERQKSRALPVTYDSEVHVQADRLGIEYRRGLARIRLGQEVAEPSLA